MCLIFFLLVACELNVYECGIISRMRDDNSADANRFSESRNERSILDGTSTMSENSRQCDFVEEHGRKSVRASPTNYSESVESIRIRNRNFPFEFRKEDLLKNVSVEMETTTNQWTTFSIPYSSQQHSRTEIMQDNSRDIRNPFGELHSQIVHDTLIRNISNFNESLNTPKSILVTAGVGCSTENEIHGQKNFTYPTFQINNTVFLKHNSTPKYENSTFRYETNDENDLQNVKKVLLSWNTRNVLNENRILNKNFVDNDNKIFVNVQKKNSTAFSTETRTNRFNYGNISLIDAEKQSLNTSQSSQTENNVVQEQSATLSVPTSKEELKNESIIFPESVSNSNRIVTNDNETSTTIMFFIPKIQNKYFESKNETTVDNSSGRTNNVILKFDINQNANLTFYDKQNVSVSNSNYFYTFSNTNDTNDTFFETVDLKHKIIQPNIAEENIEIKIKGTTPMSVVTEANDYNFKNSLYSQMAYRKISNKSELQSTIFWENDTTTTMYEINSQVQGNDSFINVGVPVKDENNVNFRKNIFQIYTNGTNVSVDTILSSTQISLSGTDESSNKSRINSTSTVYEVVTRSDELLSKFKIDTTTENETQISIKNRSANNEDEMQNRNYLNRDSKFIGQSDYEKYTGNVEVILSFRNISSVPLEHVSYDSVPSNLHSEANVDSGKNIAPNTRKAHPSIIYILNPINRRYPLINIMGKVSDENQWRSHNRFVLNTIPKIFLNKSLDEKIPRKSIKYNFSIPQMGNKVEKIENKFSDDLFEKDTEDERPSFSAKKLPSTIPTADTKILNRIYPSIMIPQFQKRYPHYYTRTHRINSQPWQTAYYYIKPAFISYVIRYPTQIAISPFSPYQQDVYDDYDDHYEKHAGSEISANSAIKELYERGEIFAAHSTDFTSK
ncbi:hypothetical protein PGB90_008171 [Kerria lacca]